MSLSRVWRLLVTDLRVASRDGEQLLLTLGLPVLLLVFFSTVDVLPTGSGEPVNFLTPGILALAVVSVSFVRLAIGLGFDRSFGAIRRFAVTPLRPSEYLAAKVAGSVVFFVGQVVVLGGVAAALGWRPSISALTLPVLVCGLVAFGALGIVVGSVVEGLTALALANALYVLLLIMSGLIFELDRLPAFLETTVKVLPSTALAELLRAALDGSNGPTWAWITLGLWTVAAPALALRLFRWD